MTVQQLIRYVRLNIDIADPFDRSCTDQAYLELSDEDIRLYLEVCMTRDFAYIPSLEKLPASCVYPLLLLVKKELYYSFAVYRAPEIDMNADMNNSLRRSQRFEHYMALIQQVDGEYQDWLDNGGSLNPDGTGSNTLTTYDVVLPNTRYFTKRYRDKAVKPNPSLEVMDYTNESIDIAWVNRCRQFGWANVYVSTHLLIDECKEGNSKVIDKEDHLVFHTLDPRQTTFRIGGLEADTDYYVVVESVDKSGLTGYYQEIVHTLTESE